MKQGGRHKAAGFTIVETMLVLAVTGSLFVSAAVLINGRQNKTEFQTGINNLQQQVQQIVNETSSGYYPTSKNFTCNGATHPVKIFAAGANNQGQNSGCIFLGKVVQFGTSVDPTQLVVYPIAGNQLNVASKNVLTVAQASPFAIAPGFVVGSSPVDASVSQSMLSGLSVAITGGAPIMSYTVGAISNPTGAVGFITGDSSGNIASSTSTGLGSGTQQLSLYAVSGTTANMNTKTLVDKINAGNLVNNVSSITACIKSGTTNQSAALTIGGSGKLSVGIKIYSGLVC